MKPAFRPMKPASRPMKPASRPMMFSLSWSPSVTASSITTNSMIVAFVPAVFPTSGTVTVSIIPNCIVWID